MILICLLYTSNGRQQQYNTGRLLVTVAGIKLSGVEYIRAIHVKTTWETLKEEDSLEFVRKTERECGEKLSIREITACPFINSVHVFVFIRLFFNNLHTACYRLPDDGSNKIETLLLA